MPLSTDVNLPRDHKAIFPNRCVHCGEDNEGKTIRLWTHTIGWWTWVLFAFGRGFKVDVPACAGCAWRIRLYRMGGLAIAMGITLIFLFFIWPQFREVFGRGYRNYVAMGMILICLTPYFVWEIVFPPAIDITAYSKNVDYEFRDEDYAYEFAELNEDAEWVNVS